MQVFYKPRALSPIETWFVCQGIQNCKRAVARMLGSYARDRGAWNPHVSGGSRVLACSAKPEQRVHRGAGPQQVSDPDITQIER